MDYKSKYLKYKKKYLELKKLSNMNGGGNKSFTYKFSDNVNNQCKECTRKYISNPNGWISKGYTIVETNNEPDILVNFEERETMDKLFGNNLSLKGLSITDRGTKPINIYFHLDNWNNPPDTFIKKYNRLDDYRAYLVQHEFGHALGYDHPNRPKNGEMKPCKVMLQQTKYTEPYCTVNPWVKNE